MIYTVIFNYIQNTIPITKFGKPTEYVRGVDIVQEILKQPKDRIAFIITRAQWNAWEVFLSHNGLRKYIEYESDQYLQNPRYPEYAPKLKLVIMKGQAQ